MSLININIKEQPEEKSTLVFSPISSSATTQHAIKCVFHTVQDQTAVFTSVVRVFEVAMKPRIVLALIT